MLRAMCLMAALFVVGSVAVDAAPPNDLTAKLTQAAAKGDLTQIEALLKAGAKIDAIYVQADDTGSGESPLAAAAVYNQLPAMQLLLDRGANVNGESGGTLSPLAAAALKNHFEAIELLIAHGANVNGDGTYTPLFAAVTYHSETAVQTLLVHGADANALSNLGFAFREPPLLFAVSMGFRNIVEMLLAHGADIKSVDPYGHTVLFGSCQGMKGDLTDETEYPAFIEYLIAKGADVNHHELISGKTPLMGFAADNCTAVAEILIAHGADANACDKNGTTVIKYATEEGQYQISDTERLPLIKLLIAHGADPKDAATARLVEAASQGDLPRMQKALDAGASINDTGTAGKTPLLASLNRFASSPVSIKAILAFLLAHGAKVDLAGRDGTTPIMAAFFKKDEVATAFLLSHGADPHQALAERLVMAADDDNLPLVQKLIAAGADINAQGDAGRTALLAASKLRAIEYETNSEYPVPPASKVPVVPGLKLVAFLLSHGADVHAHDSDGNTALHLTANAEITQLLLSHNAEVDALNAMGQTPLDYTLILLNGSVPKKSQMLIAAGSNIDIKDKFGMSSRAWNDALSDTLRQFQNTGFPQTITR